ncbi:hypothetical protein [Geminisphaera colitermitum]|uniref:hypothetical protein n=1 Tax=Geminisphaera colitermitum TaxID=1148786 RepID=UPI000196556E|nr:hypothetical protein [Geminisphaera colitermitum]RRJ98655.1 hypothetical protein Ga0100230_009875 [Opitutaceae bacterium TAV3]
MSLAEIKEEIAHLPSAELHYLAAYTWYLSRRQEPGYVEGLDASMRAMDGGEKMALDDVLRLSADLRKSGA